MNFPERSRPDLPRPSCRVILICGPPASGKSTYVREHAARDDLVIDFDLIAREHGIGRERESDEVGEILEDRNRRLALLADEPADRVAWVILSAPSKCLRKWWCDTLGVKPNDLVVLSPPYDELRRRIKNDPDRQAVQSLHFGLVDQWMQRERNNDPGLIKGNCDMHGFPTDPLHPWNARATA